MYVRIKKKLMVALVITLAVLVLPFQAFAAATSGTHTPVDGVTVSISGATDNSMTNGVITVTAKGSGGLWGIGASATTTTITVTNGKTKEAKISFDWAATSVNQLTIDGTVYSGTSSSFSKTMAAGANFTITIVTAKNSTVNTLVMSNFSIEEVQDSSDVTVLFSAGAGNSVSVNGTAVSSGDVVQVPGTGATMTASTTNFVAWINEADNTVLSKSAEFVLKPTGDMTIKAIQTTNACFEVGNKIYETLTEAIPTATNGTTKTIVLVNNGTLVAGDYTIPSGVTLLIPYDDANTLITNNAEDHLFHAYDDKNNETRKQYRKLTLSSGTTITVSSGGAISIGSQSANQFIGQVGPYGAIYMDEGSGITVADGGTLYAWGYIFSGSEGSGTVTVESGGTVYESVSIMDYPGSSSLTSAVTDVDVLPVRAYTARNVEVPMTLKSGSNEYVFYCLWGNNIGTHPGYVLFFGSQAVGDYTPVFQLASGTTVVKSYSDGIQHMAINGDISLNSLTLTIDAIKFIGTPITISSSDTSGFCLPSGYDVNIGSGTLTLNDNVIMTEGAKITIAEGAGVNTNGKNIYVLDADDDVGAVSTLNGCSISVQDVHGKYYTCVNSDAVLDVNGTLITSGGFYTSESGASIISSGGTGVIQVSKESSSGQVKVKDSSNSYQTINITPAQLKNANGSYVKTADGGVNSYTYNSTAGRWECQTHNYTDVVTAPTCTEAGYTTHTCSVCGHSYIDTITAPVEHNFVDGICTGCGAIESGLFSIAGANIKAGDGLDMFFYVSKTDLGESTDYYAVVTKTCADGRGNIVKKIPYSEWESYSSSLMRFCFSDIAAKEMTDELYITIFHSDGTPASYTKTDSVHDYAIRAMKANSSDTKLLTALVDMLNYGAAAQDYFSDYNMDDPANAGIEEFKQYATATVTYADNRVEGENYVGSTVSAENKLMLTFYFNNITTDMTATISYTDHYGNPVSLKIPGTEFYKRGDMYGVDVTGLSIADGRQLVTCVVKSGDTVVARATDSVESYVARSSSGNDVFALLMKFVSSAYSYFH